MKNPAFDRARQLFEQAPNLVSLTACVIMLLREDVGKLAIRRWATNIAREYGIADTPGIVRAIATALAPVPAAPDEPAKAEQPAAALSVDLPMPPQIDTAAEPVTAPAPDGFAGVLGLIALITDATASKARLLELRAQFDAVGIASTKLAAARATFDEHAQRIRTDLEAKTSELRRRQVKLRGEEGQFFAEREVFRRQKDALDAREGRGLIAVGDGGLMREPDETERAA